MMVERHIGFTGTREGMSEFQKRKLRVYLESAVVTAGRTGDEVVFHHGDCLGADAEAHEIAHSLGIEIVIHPPIVQRMRAFCKGIYLAPMDYLERDRHIVDSTIGMIAAPKSNKEEKRSGTWYTVRYARKTGKTVILLSRNESTETG